MNDDELEAMFRQGLRDHADDVADTGGRAAAARHGLRRRRRLQGVIAVGAAVLVIAPVGVLAATSHSPSKQAASAADGPAGWRPESYNGVQLRVPGSWAWGLTPTHQDDGYAACPDRFFPGATSFMDVRPPRGGALAVPYVGRPPASQSGCDLLWTPSSVAHVWFGSPLPVGTDPRTGVTVRVQGASSFRITVFDPNRQRQRAILASIKTVSTDSNGCATHPPRRAFRAPELSPDDVTSVSVCLYYTRVGLPPLQRSAAGASYLYYSTQVRDGASELAGALREGGHGPSSTTLDLCLGGTPSAVDLVERAGDRTYTYALLPFDCAGHPFGYWGQPDFHLITQHSVDLWAIDGAPLYAGADPKDNRLVPYLPK